MNGLAVCAPLRDVSLTDCILAAKTPADAKTVQAAFETAANGVRKAVLGHDVRPAVPTDYVNDAGARIVDALSTMVVNGTEVNVCAWYGTGWGYAHRSVDTACMVGDSF